MTDFIDENEEEAAKRKKKDDSGEGDSDSFGRGKAGAGAGGGRPTVQKLPAAQMREVWANFKQYVGDEVIEPFVDFCRDVPMRAAANAVVTWESVKGNVKSFAIVNWFMRTGEESVRSFDRGMGAASGGMAFKVRSAPGKPSTHTKGAPGQKIDWTPPVR